MIAVIVGVPGSGKSRRAEELAVRLAGDGPRVYLATMTPYGAEGAERVERHRKAREGKGFTTVERPTDVGVLAESLPRLADSVVLLECAANLVGNEIYAPENSRLDDDAIVDLVAAEIRTLADAAKALVVVTNAFPADEPGYDEPTRRYVRILDRVNDRLRAAADRVDELAEEGWRSYGDL